MPDKVAPAVWEITETRAVCERLGTVPTDDGALTAYLSDSAKKYGLRYLLAFADDGVIWGRVADGTGVLVTAPAVSPPLHASSLQSARLFGETAELLIWRAEGDGGFTARLVRDLADGETPTDLPAPLYDERIDDDLYLWGSRAETSVDGFTVWREGAEGLRHAVPFADTARPPRLRVRHYLAPNEPMARIAVSRLVGLYADRKAEKKGEPE